MAVRHSCPLVFERRDGRGPPSKADTIDNLRWRLGERFCWQYDFIAGWVIDARVEAFVDGDAPVFLSGRRGGPTEWLHGVADFERWEDSFTWSDYFKRLDQMHEVIKHSDPYLIQQLRGRVAWLDEWCQRDDFDRASLRCEVHDVMHAWTVREESCVSPSRSEPTPPILATAVS